MWVEVEKGLDKCEWLPAPKDAFKCCGKRPRWRSYGNLVEIECPACQYHQTWCGPTGSYINRWNGRFSTSWWAGSVYDNLKRMAKID